MIAGCDTLFYWTHRALHQPPLYRLLHKKHHEFKASTVWASELAQVARAVCAHA